MKKSILATSDAAAAVGPYSQGTRFGDLLFVSGQLPIAPSDGTMPEGVAAQTHQSLRNLKAVLAAGGATLEDVLKTTVFLKDMGDFSVMNDVYAVYFIDAHPARSTIEVARLPRDALVEVEAIAIAPEPALGT